MGQQFVKNLKQLNVNFSATSILSFGLAIAMTMGLGVQTSQAADFDVIANKSVKETALTKVELKQILLANQLNWSDGKPVVIVTLDLGTPEADAVATEFMGMTNIQAKKHYFTKVFGGVLRSPPPAGDSPDDVVALVEKTAGAIAVLPKGSTLGQTKVLNLK